MKNYGLIEVASISPKEIAIGDVERNIRILKDYVVDILKKNENGENQVQLIVFPELCLTGYTCSDLFNQSLLVESAYEGLQILSNWMSEAYKYYSCVPMVVVGLPIRKDNQLFNCAAIISKDGLLGIVPKTFIPNYSEFYEARYFSSSINRCSDVIDFFGKDIPFTPNLIVKDNLSDMVLGVDICEDVWVPIPPSRYHCLHGANIIANLSASNETIGKKSYREEMIKMHSATSACAYVYTSASKDESTTDTVFSGHTIIACNGGILKSEDSLSGRDDIVIAQVDIEKCLNDRSRANSYMGVIDKTPYIEIKTNTFRVKDYVTTSPSLMPFVPKAINERADEIMKIQANGLAQRLKKIHCNKVVLGISGGLDSTLALLVAVEAFKILDLDKTGIIGITMPCFGTTNRTKNNSITLMEELGISSYEIDIKAACQQHYKDINHDPRLLDITFENVQARERTQILMDVANKENAIVVGTGDLSELALGWCTYNGDQMSMYGVNASIPKTLVRSLVKSYAETKTNGEVQKTLLDICDTPISPELLPPNADGTIAQKTEESIGSYVIHDFTLYYMMRFGFSPKKIYHLCLNAMAKEYNTTNKEIYKEEILKNMKIFYNRFFKQQFKRSCMPDGVKVGSISLSPRADWRMPSDAVANLWLKELDEIK